MHSTDRVLNTGGKIYICDPRLPKIIRFIFNHHFKDSGFYSSKKNIKVFEESGFKLIKIEKDFYVQLLVFEKKDPICYNDFQNLDIIKIIFRINYRIKLEKN